MKKLTRFALSMCKVGCIGFGGGSALIPVIEEEVVKTQQLEKKENYDKDVIVASITPGALPVEIAASIGRRNFGVRGTFLGSFMIAFPGSVLTVLFLTILSMAQTRLLTVIETATFGVSAFIIFLLAEYIIRMLKSCEQESRARRNKAILVMAGTFLLSCGRNLYMLAGIERTPFFSVSTLPILLAAFFFIFYTRSDYRLPRVLITGVLCTIYLLSYGKAGLISNPYITRTAEILMLCLSVWGIAQELKTREKSVKINFKNMREDVLIWSLVLVAASVPAFLLSKEILSFVGHGLLSALMSFGGGDAYLTIAEGLFVDGGFISDSQYYGHIVNIVNMLPGSILCKTLAGIGYYAGLNAGKSMLCGIAFSFAGFICSIAASCGFYSVIYHVYDSLHSFSAFKMISRWIRPIIAGLLLNIVLSICNQCVSAAASMEHSAGMAMGTLGILIAADVLLVWVFRKKSYLALLLNLAAVFILFAL